MCLKATKASTIAVRVVKDFVTRVRRMKSRCLKKVGGISQWRFVETVTVRVQRHLEMLCLRGRWRTRGENLVMLGMVITNIWRGWWWIDNDDDHRHHFIKTAFIQRGEGSGLSGFIQVFLYSSKTIQWKSGPCPWFDVIKLRLINKRLIERLRENIAGFTQWTQYEFVHYCWHGRPIDGSTTLVIMTEQQQGAAQHC